MSRTQAEWDALGAHYPSPFDVLAALPRPTEPATPREPKKRRPRMHWRTMLISSLETPEERRERKKNDAS